MTDYKAAILWERGAQRFTDSRYSRAHKWRFDGGVEVLASSSPHVVPLPYSSAEAVDPEEAFVASLSSCHMLWFLSVAVKHGCCVDRYTDNAVGILEKNTAGQLAITRVTLRPAVVFSGPHTPTKAEINALHQEAHDQCFLANSVKTAVHCEPAFHDWTSFHD